eukprot:1160526-Pelagomonas_calceolata.AAC.10
MCEHGHAGLDRHLHHLDCSTNSSQNASLHITALAEKVVVEEKVWNWVVANISLMAFGTSAPEILLSAELVRPWAQGCLPRLSSAPAQQMWCFTRLHSAMRTSSLKGPQGSTVGCFWVAYKHLNCACQPFIGACKEEASY